MQNADTQGLVPGEYDLDNPLQPRGLSVSKYTVLLKMTGVRALILHSRLCLEPLEHPSRR